MGRKLFQRWRAPLVEIAVLAGALVAANLIWWRDDPGFTSVSPPPMLFLVLLVLARYGLQAGLVAAGVLTAEYFALLATVGRAAHPYLFAPSLMAPLVILVPATVLLGVIVQRHIDRRRRAEADARRAAEELARARAEAARLRDLNVQLGDKIVHADRSAFLVLEQLASLATLDRAELAHAALRLMGEALLVDAASYWELDGHAPRLRCFSGDAQPAALRLDAAAEREFDARDVLLAHRLPDGGRALPLAVGRVRAGRGGAVIGWLAIDRVPLEASAEAARLFALVLDWLSAATGNALAFERGAARPGLKKASR